MTHITIERAKLEHALKAFSVIAIADNLDWIQHQAEQQAAAIKQALAAQPAPVPMPADWFAGMPDDDSPSRCLDCQWTGLHRDLNGYGEQA